MQAPDVYFTRGYGQAVAASENAEWRLIELADGRWQMPLLVRELESGRKDAVSPYGYAGVYADPTLDPTDVTDLWRTTRELLAADDIVSVFVRQSPLVPQAPTPSHAIAVVNGHATFFVPTPSADAAWDAMEGRSRTAIRKSVKLQTTVSVAPATAADVAAGSDFRRLYEATMGKVQARDYYFFSDTYYEALVDGLGDDLLIGIARDPSGQALCASLFMRGPHALHYHLSGSTLEGSRGGATNAVLWAAIQLAAAQGLDGLLLGGGVHDGDGLERFKRSFGGEVKNFDAYGLVVDEQAFADEVTRTARRLGASVDEICQPGFFPAYRRTSLPPVTDKETS